MNIFYQKRCDDKIDMVGMSWNGLEWIGMDWNAEIVRRLKF